MFRSLASRSRRRHSSSYGLLIHSNLVSICVASHFPRFYSTSYGQPLEQSHAHLVPPGELTPGIPARDFEQRRRALMDALPENSVVISVAAPIKYMSGSECALLQPTLELTRV